MAERPTPHSVAVCTLVALHSDPSSLIHKTTKKTTQDNDNDNTNATNDEFIIGIEEHLSKVIKHLVIHGESIPLYHLLDLVSGENGDFIHAAEFLLEDLNQSCLSIDSLVDLFAALRATVAQGIVDGDSAHGVYVRKRCLGFDELSFESVGRFWESFCDYVEDGRDWSDQKNDRHNNNHDNDHNSSDGSHSVGPSAGKGKGSYSELNKDDSLVMDESMHSFPFDEGAEGQYRVHETSEWPLAPRQISRKLFQQCLNLHKEIGVISYEEMEARIQGILRENPELTLAHFLRFLNDAMHGERVGALESFHRYFDYAMIQERKYRLSNASIPSANNNNNNGNNNNRDGNNNEPAADSPTGNVVQYAAILLASLFHTFANDDLAYVATKEAIRVTQQSGDGACLAYALGWLHASSGNNTTNLSTFNVSSNGHHVLSRASSRAAQHNLRFLVAGASLMRAGHITTGGDNDGNEISFAGIRHPIGLIPAQAWESISAASTEAAATNSISTSSYQYDVPTHVANLADSTEAMTIFSQQYMAGSGLWHCMGHLALASTSFQTTIRCYQAHLSSQQYGLVAKEIASSAMYGTGSERSYFNQESSDAQSLSSSLEQLRLTSKNKNSNSDTAVPGLQPTSMYQNALQKLREVLGDTPKVSGVKWCHDVILLLHESSVQQCNLHNASSLNTLLQSCAPLASRECAKVSVEFLGQTCLLSCRQMRWESAKSIILERIIPICEMNKFHYYHAYYLLQLAIIHFDSSPYQPVLALSPILECLSLTEKYSIDMIHASALSLLARAHFELGNCSLAKSILNAAMPMILQNAHVCFQGETLLCLAKCTMSEAKELDKKSTSNKKFIHVGRKKNALLKVALSQLQKSQKAFEKAVDVIRLREVYYLLAQCHASLPGHVSRRNMAAKRFREMNRIKVQSNLPLWYDAIGCVKGSIACETC